MWRNWMVVLAALFTCVATPATGNGQLKLPGGTLALPFDPPLGEGLQYRSETFDTKDGKTQIIWSIDELRFEQTEDGYRLIAEPVTFGSNETDPVKLAAYKQLEELTRRPFVLQLNESGEIVALENADEYWAKIFQALRHALLSDKTADKKVVEAVISMFEAMPPEVRLAKLTETIQPIVEFANTETVLRKPLKARVPSTSPFGGTLTRDVVISLTDVKDGLAHLTIRSTIPRDELEKLTTALFDKITNGGLSEDQVAKVKIAIAGLKEFKEESVAEYKIRTEDGVLYSFQSKQVISATEGEKTTTRTKVRSLKLVQ